MAMGKHELMLARAHSERELICILMELGAQVQFTLGHIRSGGKGPIAFQAFWPTGIGYDGRHVDYDARAHANVIP